VGRLWFVLVIPAVFLWASVAVADGVVHFGTTNYMAAAERLAICQA
jgi:hypothetical protein